MRQNGADNKNTQALLLPGERVEDLQNGFFIIQSPACFAFGTDAVLLAHFVRARAGERVVDFGTGDGIIPILLCAHVPGLCVTGLEVQPELADLAKRSVALNGLEERVSLVYGDIREARKLLGTGFDVVVTNPPYINRGGGIVNPLDTKAISRHELFCSLEDVIRTSSKLLVPCGRFAMVHKPERLADIIYLMRTWKIEPKYLRFVHPSPYKKPNLLLIRGIKNGNPELKMMEPLYVYDENGNYSDEINRIYGREVKKDE